MKKLKLVFKILSVVVAILLLALVALIFTFDPNNYKDVEDIKVYNNPSIFAESLVLCC